MEPFFVFSAAEAATQQEIQQQPSEVFICQQGVEYFLFFIFFFFSSLSFLQAREGDIAAPIRSLHLPPESCMFLFLSYLTRRVEDIFYFKQNIKLQSPPQCFDGSPSEGFGGMGDTAAPIRSLYLPPGSCIFFFLYHTP